MLYGNRGLPQPHLLVTIQKQKSDMCTKLRLAFYLVWSVFAARSAGRIRSIFTQTPDWSDRADAQADLILHWLHMTIWALTGEKLSSGIWDQQKRRPACTSSQSDQCLCYSFIGKHHIWACYRWTFNFLASLCSWGDSFELWRQVLLRQGPYIRVVIRRMKCFHSEMREKWAKLKWNMNTKRLQYT